MIAVLDEKDKLPLLVIAGPTAVGKSELAIRLAQKVHGEIISCDSAQVYRGLNVGTAKIQPAQMQGVAHHLLDVVDARERFTVADYQQRARDVIWEVAKRGHLPVIVGGTGLWLRALVRGFEFSPEEDHADLRSHITEIARHHGWESIRRLLRMVDVESYRKISSADRRRLARALEVWWSSGRRLARSPGGSPYRVSYWVLFRPIASIHARIAERAQAMLAEGLQQEVMSLLSQGVERSAQSLNAIGYRETVDWCYGRVADAELENLIRRHTEQLAKRQMTWFRSEGDVHWLDLEAYGEVRALSALERAAVQLLETL